MKCEALCFEWHITWRQRVRDAYRNPDQQDGYSLAAVLAHMQYLCYHALESWKVKSND